MIEDRAAVLCKMCSNVNKTRSSMLLLLYSFIHLIKPFLGVPQVPRPPTTPVAVPVGVHHHNGIRHIPHPHRVTRSICVIQILNL